MEATSRPKADPSLPRPIWVDSSGLWNRNAGLPPSVGVLLEWRQAVNDRGQQSWEGLVIWANANTVRGWSSGLTWMRSGCIRPMQVSDWRGALGQATDQATARRP